MEDPGSREHKDAGCFSSFVWNNSVYKSKGGLFRSNYIDHPPVVSVEQSPEIITEQSGYMSTKEMVERAVLAGQRLYDYRHGILDMERDYSSDDSDEIDDQMESCPYDEDPVDASIRLDSEILYRGSKKAPESSKKAPESVEMDVPGRDQEKASSGPSEGPPDA